METSTVQTDISTSLRRFIADWIFPEGLEQRNRSEREASIDPLTGLANRRAFDRARATAETDQETTVILFDANNFGKVNKTVGHTAGDALLRDLGAVIERCASRYGFGSRAFRIGGDEFVVLSSGKVADLIRMDVESEFGERTIGGFRISVSGTLGRTLDQADQILQARKQEAKN